MTAAAEEVALMKEIINGGRDTVTANPIKKGDNRGSNLLLSHRK